MGMNSTRVEGAEPRCGPAIEGAFGGLWAAGAVSVAVSFGLQLTLAGFLISSWTKRREAIAATLTDAGRLIVAPERDLEIFALGVLLTVALMLPLARWWRRPAREGTPQDAGVAYGGAWLGIVAMAGLACFGFIYRTVQSLKVAEFGERKLEIVLLCPAVLTVLSAAIAATGAARWKPAERASLARRWWLHILVVALIVLVVYIPGYRWSAGYVVWHDLSHHWDHFVMGPAVGYLHGRALGADLYSQYGMGYPVLFAILSPILPLNYGNLYLCAVVYGCIYYSALYLLLLLWTKRAGWAAAGTFLAVVMQLMWGTIGRLLWTYPASTVLRAPLDVWVLLALLLYVRKPRLTCAIASGALVGLALFFETDTGISIALAWGAFWLMMVWMTWAQAGKQQAFGALRGAGIGAAAALAVAFAGLCLGSRGAVLHRAFWGHWLEAIRATRGGLSLLPLSAVAMTPMTIFVGVLIVYFTSIGRVALRLFQRRAEGEDALQGSLALYGLVCMQLFVGRSAAPNVYHVVAPAAMILAVFVARSAQTLEELISRSAMSPPNQQRWQAARFGTFGMIGIGGVSLALQFSDPAPYENLLWRYKASPKMLKERRSAVYSAKLGVLLPRDKHEDATVIGEKIRRIRSTGKAVAVLDFSDTRYYLVGGCAPWGRHSPLIPGLVLKSQLRELESDLVSKHPDYVVIRRDRGQANMELDVWVAIHRVLNARYRPVEEAAGFKFWRWNQ